MAIGNIPGRSPKEIIDERVMLDGKRLLIYTRLSVKEIGYSPRFAEPTNFIKYFLKRTRRTPVEFRQEFAMQEGAKVSFFGAK